MAISDTEIVFDNSRAEKNYETVTLIASSCDTDLEALDTLRCYLKIPDVASNKMMHTLIH